jgi:DNA-binding MarR family transcriptional regulator
MIDKEIPDPTGLRPRESPRRARRLMSRTKTMRSASGIARAKKSASSRGPEAFEPDAFHLWLRFLRLNQRLRILMARGLREIGLSIPQFDVLAALSEGAGITQRELAGRLFVTKGNVSGLVDRLVAAKLVERRRGSPDRRSRALFLTGEGKRMAAAGFAVQKIFVARTLGRLSRRDLGALQILLGRWHDAARDGEPARERMSVDAPRAGAGEPRG